VEANVTRPLHLALSVSLLVAALLALQLRSSGEATPVRKPLDSFPGVIDAWQGRGGEIFDANILNVLKVKDYVMRRYQDPAGRSLWLFIGYWDTQRKGAQPHSPKNCLPGSGWEPLEASRVEVPLPRPFSPISVNRYLIQKDREQQLVFYWYEAQGKAVAGEVAARVEMVKNSIARNRSDGALVRVSSPIYDNVPETSSRLIEYIQAMYPILHEYLPD
jgi:EpsI family protein